MFNSEITDEEIMKTVKSLMRGKAGGEDNSIHSFFIHDIAIFLHILNRIFNRMFLSGECPTS